MIGNVVYLPGKSVRTVITARPDANTLTMSQTVSAGSGLTATIGGALLTVQAAVGTWFVGGNDIHAKVGTYTDWTAVLQMDYTGAATNFTNIIGYNTTRLDCDTTLSLTRPTFKRSSGSNYIMIDFATGNYATLRNVIIDGNATAVRGFNATYKVRFHNVKVTSCNGTFTSAGAVVGSTTCILDYCEFTGAGGTQSLTVAGASHFYFCSFHDNTVHGVVATGSPNPFFSHCLFYRNTGASSDGFNATGAINVTFLNCVFADNGRTGANFVTAGAEYSTIFNSVFYNNAAYGVDGAAVMDGLWLFNCAFGANGTNPYNATNVVHVINELTLTVDPFTNRATGDFTINNTAGGGKVLQSAGWAPSHPGNSTRGNPTVGPDPSKGGGSSPGVPPPDGAQGTVIGG